MPEHVIRSEAFMKWLSDGGVIQEGQMVRRVIIDATVGEILRVYVEQFGQKKLTGELIPPDLLAAAFGFVGDDK